MIEVADIKYVAAREINWGADFEDLEERSKIIYLKKFSASMNQAADLIQKERDGLLNDIDVMRKMLESAEQATQAQRMVMITSITNHNLAMQKIGDEMVELKAELRGYKNGDNS
jgi:hypothetical protein